MLFHVIAFKKNSKESLFDYGIGIHRRKEDFLKKKCNVPLEYVKECQRSL